MCQVLLTISVRVVRVILKSDEVETLITNLSEDEFSADDFLDLYFLRWGIETTYDTLKNKLLLEKFAGRSHVAVLQEYYAIMFVLYQPLLQYIRTCDIM